MVDADLGALPEDPGVARDLLADQLELVWTELLEPNWPRMHQLLTADIEYRSRRLAAGGITLALTDIHPQVRLAEDVLMIDVKERSRITPDRRGLLLIPGVFAWPRVGVITVPPWRPAVLYPARGVAELWTTAAKPNDALAGGPRADQGDTPDGTRRAGEHFRTGDQAGAEQRDRLRASHCLARRGFAHHGQAWSHRALPAHGTWRRIIAPVESKAASRRELPACKLSTSDTLVYY
jgi:hypothetical protein